MMMTVMRVTISRRDTADTAITSKSLSLLVSISPGTDVEVGHVVESSEVRTDPKYDKFIYIPKAFYTRFVYFH